MARLGNTPRTILRRNKMSLPPSAGYIDWRKAQEAMQSLCTRGFPMVAKHPRPVIPYGQPQAVADATRRLIAETGKR